MNFEESEEQQMLRAAVSSIAARYGHEYYVERSRTAQKTDELWDELASFGFLGVNVPEQYGGGGQGISELAIVEEELAAQGCPLLLLVFRFVVLDAVDESTDSLVSNRVDQLFLRRGRFHEVRAERRSVHCNGVAVFACVCER